MATLEWVAWFNQERVLAPPGYVAPAEFEAQYSDTQSIHGSVGVLSSTSLLQTRRGSQRPTTLILPVGLSSEVAAALRSSSGSAPLVSRKP